jgi:2'-5' RNA ligase
MPELWRLFVAVPVPAALRADLVEQLAPMRAVAPDGIRWVDPDACHLTLAFLGDTDPARVPDLAAALHDAVAPLPAFTARIGGFGAIPRPSSARVIWLGVDGGEDLRHLARVVADACGVNQPVRPRPHITVGRFSQARSAVTWLATQAAPHQVLSVERTCLEKSRLEHGTRRHVRVVAVSLQLSRPNPGRETGRSPLGRRASRAVRRR